MLLGPKFLQEVFKWEKLGMKKHQYLQVFKGLKLLITIELVKRARKED